MEIPDEVLIPGIYSTFIFLLIGYVFGETIFFFDASTYTNIQDLVVDHIIGATILYTFLYIQILIPGGIHLLPFHSFKKRIQEKEKKRFQHGLVEGIYE
jgi:hypothetical protein